MDLNKIYIQTFCLWSINGTSSGSCWCFGKKRVSSASPIMLLQWKIAESVIVFKYSNVHLKILIEHIHDLVVVVIS